MSDANMNPLFKETIIFRPLLDYRNSKLLRYNNGKWMPDDGESDLAFVDQLNAVVYGVILPNYLNVIWSWHDLPLTLSIVGEKYRPEVRGWHTQTTNNGEMIRWDDADRDKHPNQIAYKEAMDKCCELHHCASGHGVSLTGDSYSETNSYYEQGLVYIKGIMQPVKRPDNPICYQCLNNGLLHKQEAFESLYSSTLGKLDYTQEHLNKAEIEVYDCEREINAINAELSEMKSSPFYKTELEVSE
jgi:hypothetical protein